jgi:hypothetical protein
MHTLIVNLAIDSHNQCNLGFGQVGHIEAKTLGTGIRGADVAECPGPQHSRLEEPDGTS